MKNNLPILSIIIMLVLLAGCASVPTADLEDTRAAIVTPTREPTATSTVTLVPSPTPSPEPTVDTRWEIPDDSLTEQIKSTMPTMWYYDREAKSFVERSADDFSFRIFERTTLYIYDKEGNEIGFAKYFTRSNLENENTEYYSLTDQSTKTMIPIRLFAEMGDFDIAANGIDTNECVYAFSENMATFPGPFNQNLIDRTNKYALDIAQISDGEEMMQAALIRTEVVDGRLISYDGVTTTNPNCTNLSIGYGLSMALHKSFDAEVLFAFDAGKNPILSIYEGRTSVVTTRVSNML